MRIEKAEEWRKRRNQKVRTQLEKGRQEGVEGKVRRKKRERELVKIVRLLCVGRGSKEKLSQGYEKRRRKEKKRVNQKSYTETGRLLHKASVKQL